MICVFDAQKRELRLYLDGLLKGTQAMNGAWQPAGDRAPVIGNGQTGGSPNNWVHGDVDEVRVYQGVVTDVTRIP